MLGLQVQPNRPREGSDQTANHAGQQREELWVCSVFAIEVRLPKRGLVGKGRERVDVGEEIVNQQVQNRQRRNGLGIKERLGALCASDRDEGLCGIVRAGADVRLEARSLRSCGLCGFGMFVRRSATLHLAIEGALDIEVATWSAWLGLVALEKKAIVSNNEHIFELPDCLAIGCAPSLCAGYTYRTPGASA